MNIFKDHRLYPQEDTPLLEHYAPFDAVFIGLLPFFKYDKTSIGTTSSKKLVSYNKALKNDASLERLGKRGNVEIYESNRDYPSDEEIAKRGRAIPWAQIIAATDLRNYKELNKTLMTSIGGFKKPLERQDLVAVLTNYTNKNKIWHPSEGGFDPFTKMQMYGLFKKLGNQEIWVEDEFYEQRFDMDLDKVSKSEFMDNIKCKDYYVYPKDRSILFSISWDYFFFFMAIKEHAISKKQIEGHFEGFWASPTDTHNWTWEEGEIQRLLGADG